MDAEEAFKQAETLFKQSVDHKYKFTPSYEGFCHCDLLLEQSKYKEVRERANYSLKAYSQKEKVLLDIGLDKLSLGQAYMFEAVTESGGWTLRQGSVQAEAVSLAKAEDFLNKAVDGLREAGMQDLIPLGLLVRAELNRYKRNFDKACGDLEQAREIAERGEMNLFLADYHLEAARISLAEGGKEKEAREHYEEAAKRIEEMGYHRRDPEVLLIQAELEIVKGNKKSARETLKKAKKRIDEMGCHRWDVDVERIENLECRM